MIITIIIVITGVVWLRMQVVIAKHGLSSLLSTNYYFTDLLTGGLFDKEPEQKLVWLCGGILSNIALHPNNRSGPPSPLGIISLTCLTVYNNNTCLLGQHMCSVVLITMFSGWMGGVLSAATGATFTLVTQLNA